MIDWNNNGKIDPEEVFLTEEILGEYEHGEDEEKEQDEYDEEELIKQSQQQAGRNSGCLFMLLTLPFVLIMKGLHL